MGIIGVVAALTLPNLNSSTGEKEKVAKVKKIYSNLEDAYGRMIAIYGPMETWASAKKNSVALGERITEFMKVSKVCNGVRGCFSEKKLVYPDGGDTGCNNYWECIRNYQGYYQVILADGASLAFEDINSEELRLWHIRVDIDGPNKGKNMIGYDIFDFTIDEEDNFTLAPSAYPQYQSGAFDSSEAAYSTLWVVRNENLDYLKCSNLNWDTKTSCK